MPATQISRGEARGVPAVLKKFAPAIGLECLSELQSFEIEGTIEIGEWNGCQEGPCISMNRRIEQRLARGNCYDPSRVHDGDSISHIVDNRKITGNEQIGETEFLLQIL